jgi:hypothetical protein
VGERRTQLGDAFEPLGAQAKELDTLLIRDVLKDRGRGPIGVASLPFHVGRRDPDVDTPGRRRDDALAPRRPHALDDGALERVCELRRDRRNRREDGPPAMVVEVDVEELTGRRVGVEEVSALIDRDDAAADVEQDVRRLEPNLRQLGRELLFARPCLLQLGAEIRATEGDDGKDRELEPDGDRRRGGAAPDGVREVEDVAERGHE